jgi:ABC-type multidrug transport system fused ATPase/permease subunit
MTHQRPHLHPLLSLCLPFWAGRKPLIPAGALTLHSPGIALIVATYTYMVTWTYTGEVNAKRVREQYLKAILRQDIAYFDKVRLSVSQRLCIF